MKPFRPPFFPAREIRLEWILAVGVAAGAGVARQLPENWTAWLVFSLAVLFVTGLAGLLFQRRIAFALLLALGGGALAVGFSRSLPADHYARLLDGRPRSGRLLLRICDTTLPDAPELPPPNLIAAEALTLHLTGEAEAFSVTGKVFFRLPVEIPFRPRYGDILLLDGSFRPPEADVAYLDRNGEIRPAPAGGADFASYLKARRVAAIFSAREMEFRGNRAGLMGYVLAVRDTFLERAWSRIEQPHYRQNTAGIFFGCRSGLDPAGRRDLVRSGTIHIFAVSGLHVGILAGVLFILLRPLPFRLRHLLVPVLVLLYVLTTGGNVPALRAFWMVALWCLLRMCLLKTPPLNILLLLAAIMILFNPDNLGDVGFLYSFVITSVLLLFAQHWRILRPYFLDPAPMMPDSPRQRRAAWRGKWKFRFLGSIATCVVAFLGGSAISLAFQGLFLPGAVLANLLIMPLVALLFQLMALKLLLGWVAWLDQLFAWAIDFFFLLMELVISFAAAVFDSTSGRAPSLIELVIFYVALVLMLAPGRAVTRLAAGFTLLGVLVFWHLPASDRSSVLLLYGGRTEEPAIGMVDRAAGIGLAVNVPDSGAAVELARYFKRQGISRIDRILFSRPRTAAANGLGALLKEMPVNMIELPPPDSYQRIFLSRLEELETVYPDLAFTEFGGGVVRILRENETLQIDYSNPGSNVTCQIRFDWQAVVPFCEISAGDRSFRRELPAGNLTEITEYEF